MDIISLVPSNLAILIAVIYVMGIFLKNTEKVKDPYIVIILMGFSVIFAIALVMLSGQYATAPEAFVNGILQGILCWGVSIGINQTSKQLTKKD